MFVLVLVLVLAFVLLVAVASGAVVLAARYASGRRLEQEIHTTGALEPIAARSGPDPGGWEPSARAA